jgi:deazaflavin-dependent oxidoreductase (nitroreductase family)
MNTPAGAQRPFDGEYVPSPVSRIRDQVALYEATDGTQGNTLEDRPVVILTTIGAKTSKVRKNPIMRIEDDGTYLAVASAAGAPDNPAWYANLTAHPDVLVQDGAAALHLRARGNRYREATLVDRGRAPLALLSATPTTRGRPRDTSRPPGTSHTLTGARRLRLVTIKDARRRDGPPVARRWRTRPGARPGRHAQVDRQVGGSETIH